MVPRRSELQRSTEHAPPDGRDERVLGRWEAQTEVQIGPRCAPLNFAPRHCSHTVCTNVKSSYHAEHASSAAAPQMRLQVATVTAQPCSMVQGRRGPFVGVGDKGNRNSNSYSALYARRVSYSISACSGGGRVARRRASLVNVAARWHHRGGAHERGSSAHTGRRLTRGGYRATRGRPCQVPPRLG